MDKCDGAFTCPQCGDTLIHQFNRGVHESSSAYGQHIHDDYPIEFFYCDIDGAIYKRMTGILRVIEHKEPGKYLKPSEESILGFIQLGINHLIAEHKLHAQSGAFVLYSKPPWHKGMVESIKNGNIVTMDKHELGLFESGRMIYHRSHHMLSRSPTT